MKFIAKYIQAIGLLMLTGFVAAAAALYFDTPARAAKRPAATTAVVSESHAGCNHAQASASAKPETPAATGCAHSGGGCCSAKAETPAPSAGGCTRDHVATTESVTP